MRRLYVVPTRGRLRRRLIGTPLGSGAADDQLLPKRLALPVFAADVLSSTAYATEAALVVLLAASLTSYDMILPIAVAVAALMAVVVFSYRQTVAAYPGGGGAYVVAGENLGPAAGIVAAASLLVDYVLTVAVSVAAGVLALTSAVDELEPAHIELALMCVALLALVNLRGLRDAGRAVALPVYAFVLVMAVTVVVGLAEDVGGALPLSQVEDPTVAGAAQSVGLLVLLRAFASGCSALTGVEAIANAVPAFREPKARNANLTLLVLGAVAVALFLGITYLAYATRALPSEGESVLSQVVRAVWPTDGATAVVFYVAQILTFGILLLAANASFQGFPRLIASMANAGAAPRRFQYVGDRLVFSNGVIALAVLSAALLIGFDVQVDSLIHLYLVGVFLAFTLSQAGMVVLWRARRRRGVPRTTPGLLLNAIGAAVTGTVLLVILFTKFTEGAWTVVVVIPLIVATALVIARHYRAVERVVREPAPPLMPVPDPAAVVVLVDRMDEHAASALRASAVLAGGRSRRAVHVGRREGWDALTRAWRRETACDLPLGPMPAVYGEGPDAVAAHLRTIGENEGGQVIALLPSPPEGLRRWRDARAWRRLRRRLEREPSIAVAQMPRSTSGGWWEAERTVAMVAMARPFTPARRAVVFAEALADSETWAVHVAGSEREAEAAEGWRHEVPVHLEVVESAYRDLGPPIAAAVHDVVDGDPTVVCVLVVPEVLVTGRAYGALHNQRTAILRRALAGEERTIVMTLPYPVDV